MISKVEIVIKWPQKIQKQSFEKKHTQKTEFWNVLDIRFSYAAEDYSREL